MDENKNVPEEEFEEADNYISLVDDDGNDVTFEVLDNVEYDGRFFAVLLPFEEDADGVVIFEMIPADEENIDFIAVDDDELANNVYEEFKKNYEGDYEFE